jgi:hypothetical protein
MGAGTDGELADAGQREAVGRGGVLVFCYAECGGRAGTAGRANFQCMMKYSCRRRPSDPSKQSSASIQNPDSSLQDPRLKFFFWTPPN